MLNKKGMSLVEVVIAIAILSIGAAVMYSGFTTIAKMMVDSKVYTENVNDQLSALNGKVENGVTLNTSEEEVKVTIRFEEGDKKDFVEISSSLIVATSDVDTVNTLNLKRLDFDEVEEKSDIDEYLDSITGFLNKIGVMTDAERIAHFKELEKDSGYSFSAKYQFDNNNLLLAHYLSEFKDGYPSISRDLIEKCNTIYDVDHPNPTPGQHEANARLGDDEYYMHTYFANAGKLHEFIMEKKGKVKTEELYNFLFTFADTKQGYYSLGWASSLCYNPHDKSWYYKRFPPGNMDKGSKFSFAEFYKDGVLIDFYNNKLENPAEFAKIK